MIWFYIGTVVALLLAYTFDFKSALTLANRSPKNFEKVEKNKALVYAVTKDWEQKSDKNKNEMHIINMSGWVFITIIFGVVGKVAFGFGFWEASLLYLVTQTLAHILGALSNCYALIKIPKENPNG